MKKLLVINAGLGGEKGNSAELARRLCKLMPKNIKTETITLAEVKNMASLQANMLAADGFVFTTGTYWQAYSSHLQRFFEDVTLWEGTDVWRGKPAATLVTMHSVAGQEVMSRLQANLNILGAYTPPMCGLVYSAVGHMLLTETDVEDDDIWSLDCLKTIAHNLNVALNQPRSAYVCWEVDRGEIVTKRWLK